MNNSELNFFASANSGRGFVNFYGDIFKGLKKHYIIKGGPGTGKSSLMKAVAAAAENKGMRVERFYCSSDPGSLDGIIIKELSTGITDGTAPHTADPIHPGVTEEIIDLGRFWNKDILKSSQEHIIDSTQRKAELYKDVYSYLSAALAVDRVYQRALKKVADIRTLNVLARSYTDVIPLRRGVRTVRLTDGITMKGYYRFEPYNDEADVIYNLKDSYGIGHLFLGRMLEILCDSEITVSYDALDVNKVNMLYLPSDKILFHINGDRGEEIDLNDFVSESVTLDSNALSARESLIADAYSLLSQTEKEHFALEKIYMSAMDFSLKEDYQEMLIKEIFT